MPGLFDPWSIGQLELQNRIIVSPMCQYMALETGEVTEWHVVHYGSMALGGPSLVMVEATGVEARGRISVHDVSLYDDVHVGGLRRIVDFVHQQGVKIGVQLAHAGRKADVPDPILAPSAIRFSDHYQTPLEMSRAHQEEVLTAFRAAALRAIECGFDIIEIHMAHGYLLHQFLSPFSNQRADEFGGSPHNRARFPLQVIDTVKKAAANRIPVGIRVSATDYVSGGYNEADMVQFCKAFVDHGVDVIDVSSGGNAPIAPPFYPGYQVPFAGLIKRAVSVPVIAVGMLDDPLLAEHVVRSGETDAVAVGRGFLRDKHWGHSAAKALRAAPRVPKPYERAYL